MDRQGTPDQVIERDNCFAIDTHFSFSYHQILSNTNPCCNQQSMMTDLDLYNPIGKNA
jgi:hypothetical protein